jgi:hypothetical protein
MFYNKFFKILEFIVINLFFLCLFFYYPITAIALLFIYSIIKENFYFVILLSIIYDTLFSNIFFSTPFVTIAVIISSLVLFFTKRLIFGTVRRNKVDYDF